MRNHSTLFVWALLAFLPVAKFQVPAIQLYDAVFVHCYMDDHIGPEGYARISSRDSTGERIWFEVQPNSRFFEYGSYGPGAMQSASRPNLNAKERTWYTISNVLNGWVP